MRPFRSLPVLLSLLMLVPLVSALNSVSSGNASLVIWDDTDNATRFTLQDIVFYANYTNTSDGSPISGSAFCSFSEDSSGAFSPSVNMSFNDSTSLYQITRRFVAANQFTFQVSCGATNFTPLTTTDSFTVTAVPGRRCGIDIFDLDVSSSGRITAFIKNTGNWTERINRTLRINNQVIETSVSDVNPNEMVSLSRDHGFGAGRFNVTLDAFADCGSADTETVIHENLERFTCQDPQGVSDQFRCDYFSQTLFQCRNNVWAGVNTNGSEYCFQCAAGTCGDGVCNCGETLSSCAIDCTASACSMKIESFDFTGTTLETLPGQANVVIRNTGNNIQRTRINFFVNSTFVSGEFKDISRGALYSKSFQFRAHAGNHTIKVVADATCGASEAANGSITVQRVDIRSVRPTDEIRRPSAAEAPVASTTASFSPSGLDIPQFGSKVITVDVRSARSQDFLLSVSGVPADWVSYDTATRVDRADRIYVYIQPKEQGSYNVSLELTADGEGITFSSMMPVFVAEPLPEQRPDLDIASVIRTFLDRLSKDPATLIATLIVILVIVFILGGVRLRSESVMDLRRARR